MTTNASDDQIAEAFNTILNQFPQSRSNLVKELTAAVETGDHNSIAELTARLRRIDTLKTELEWLQEEWQSVFIPEPEETTPFVAQPVTYRAPIAVPDQYELCGPTLKALHTLGGKGRIPQIVDTVISQMSLTEEVTRQLHEGGPQTELEWALGWSRTILKTCGMIDNPLTGIWELTETGVRQQWMDAAEIRALYEQRLDERRQRGGE